MAIVLAALAIGVLSAILCFSQVLDPEQRRDLKYRIRIRQFTIGQMMAAIVVAGLALHALSGPGRGGGLSVVLLFLLLLIWFVRNWQREFVFLMGLRDSDLPGRHDKLIWATVLMAFAPIGVWFFRSYRLAHWPESAIDRQGYAQQTGGGRATQSA
jgi:hypothetical protein